MYCLTLSLLVFKWWMISICVRGQTYEEMDQLYKNLFNGTYNNNVRPLINQSDVIQVAVTHTLLSIDQFNIQTGVLSISGYFTISWKDQFLSWNLLDYGNRTMVHARKEQIWIPQIAYSNGPTKNADILGSESFSPVFVTHEGDVMMTVAGRYNTKCHVDPSKYPFDRHTCTFSFFSSSQLSSELSFHLPFKYIRLDKFEQHHEWSIEKTYTSSVDEATSLGIFKIPAIGFSVVLERRVTYFAINIQVPLILLTIQQTAGVLVPVSCGERISYCMTIYVGVVFIIIAVWESIPNMSLRLPIVCYIVIAHFIYYTLVVISHIFVIRLSMMSPTDFELNVSKIMKKYALFLKRKNMGTKCTARTIRSSSTKVEPFDDNKHDADSECIQDVNGVDEKSDSDTMEEISGLDVATAINKTCFVIAVMLSIISSLVYMTVI